MNEELAVLLAAARALPPMTEDERQEQSLSFAHGNLSCSTNHKPTRAGFASVARQMGWTKERFAKWAAGKEWWTR